MRLHYREWGLGRLLWSSLLSSLVIFALGVNCGPSLNRQSRDAARASREVSEVLEAEARRRRMVQAYTAAVADDGSTYVAGQFSRTADLNPEGGEFMATSVGLGDAFVLRLDPSGSFQWVRTWGAGGSDSVRGIAVAPDGSVIVTGTLKDSVDLDPGPGTDVRTSAGEMDSYVMGLNPEGDYLWALTIGGPSQELVEDLVVDSTGAIYVVGSFMDTVDFNPGEGEELRTASGNGDAFILKLSAQREFQWIHTFGSRRSSKAKAVALLPDGSVVIAGVFEEQVDFDPGPGEDLHASEGRSDAFLVCLSDEGVYQWARSFGGATTGMVRGVAITSQGSITIAGDFRGSWDLDPGTSLGEHHSAGGSDAFVVQMDSQGEYQWSGSFGGQGEDNAKDIAAGPDGTLVVSGFFHGNADLDPGPGVSRQNGGAVNSYSIALDSNGICRGIWSPGLGVTWGVTVTSEGTVVSVGQTERPNSWVERLPLSNFPACSQ